MTVSIDCRDSTFHWPDENCFPIFGVVESCSKRGFLPAVKKISGSQLRLQIIYLGQNNTCNFNSQLQVDLPDV